MPVAPRLAVPEEDIVHPLEDLRAGRPAPVAPDDLVLERVRAEDLVEQAAEVVADAPVAVHKQGAPIGEQGADQLELLEHRGQVLVEAVLPAVGVGDELALRARALAQGEVRAGAERRSM